MGKVSNETKLVLKLGHERMVGKRLDWNRRAAIANANSNNPSWLQGYEDAWSEWNNTLDAIIAELETK